MCNMRFFSICFFMLLCAVSRAQQTDYVDFITLDAAISFDVNASKVLGNGVYDFKIKKPVDSIVIDARTMTFNEVRLKQAYKDSVMYEHFYDGSKLVIKSDFVKNESYKLFFTYEATPKKALYFVKRQGDVQIWTQGQGKYTSNWLPSFDDVNEKVVFDLSVEYQNGYEVLANGRLVDKVVKDSVTVWKYDMKQPMSSYLVALAIGKYRKNKIYSASGIPLEMYYYPEDTLKAEPTYRYSKRMFDLLEKEIGVPYPWQNYKQAPVHDFLYAGMENTSLTLFSDAYVVDAVGFNDKNYVNVNAHELAHQWFGDMVTATSGVHHWLQEGFATYYALRAERHIFGADYFDYKLYESAQQLWQQDKLGQGTSLLDPKSSSLTFYQRGAWVLYALRLKIGGKAFKAAVKSYLEQHQFGNVNTDDFLKEVVWQSKQDLIDFKRKWLLNKTFPYEDAMHLLKTHSTFIQEFLMVDCEARNSKCTEYLKYGVSDEAKVKVISQMPELVNKDVFRSSVKVRQAIAQYLTKIPQDLRSAYETLLNDDSYLTKEYALYNLWVNFPENREAYLDVTKDIKGFGDLNVRLLWLVLHLNTPEYEPGDKQKIYDELINYTSEDYSAELRLNAFYYIDLIKACNTQCRRNLENARSHHNWRLVKFAKDHMKQLKEE